MPSDPPRISSAGMDLKINFFEKVRLRPEADICGFLFSNNSMKKYLLTIMLVLVHSISEAQEPSKLVEIGKFPCERVLSAFLEKSTAGTSHDADIFVSWAQGYFTASSIIVLANLNKSLRIPKSDELSESLERQCKDKPQQAFAMATAAAFVRLMEVELR